LLLPPSDAALARTAAARNALADPHALTIGLHVRSGFADGHPDGYPDGHPDSRRRDPVEEEAAGVWALAAAEWSGLVEAAVDCALALEVNRRRHTRRHKACFSSFHSLFA
jgi:hypothetical protein